MIPNVGQLASMLVEDLKKSRQMGKSSPENPVESEMIISTYKKIYEYTIRKSDIREAIWYAVVIMKAPIGSNLDGYFYCIKSKEIQDYALPHLLSRIQKQYQRIESLKQRAKEYAETEAEQQIINFKK